MFSPYIVHAPELLPDGRCALCGRQTAIVGGRLQHKRDPRNTDARTRYACAAPDGPAGEPCRRCGRMLREYLPGKVEHARGRIAGVSPHALRGTPSDRARRLRLLRHTPRGMCECGARLDAHPPLPKPSPLTSWKAQRAIEDSLYLR